MWEYILNITKGTVKNDLNRENDFFSVYLE